jgi:hypothetical protein
MSKKGGSQEQLAPYNMVDLGSALPTRFSAKESAPQSVRVLKFFLKGTHGSEGSSF